MLHLSDKTEALARRVAETWDVPVDKAVQLALEASSQAPAGPSRRDEIGREELLRRLEIFSARAGERPVIDPRSPDEIIGYDEYGLPR